MSISKEDAQGWAEDIILTQINDRYEFSDVYEYEEFTDEYPDEEDWKIVHNAMLKAKVQVSWDE